MFTLLGIFQDNVPIVDCTVKEFILGALAIVICVAVASFVWTTIKAL